MTLLGTRPSGELVGIWESKTQYKVMDPVTGRSEVVGIWGLDDELDHGAQRSELEQQAREWVARDWKKKVEKPKPNKAQRLELGGAVRDIVSSQHYRRDNGHGRYW